MFSIDDLVQDCCISFANGLDILQCCTKPSICTMFCIGLNDFYPRRSYSMLEFRFANYDFTCYPRGPFYINDKSWMINLTSGLKGDMISHLCPSFNRGLLKPVLSLIHG